MALTICSNSLIMMMVHYFQKSNGHIQASYVSFITIVFYFYSSNEVITMRLRLQLGLETQSPSNCLFPVPMFEILKPIDNHDGSGSTNRSRSLKM